VPLFYARLGRAERRRSAEAQLDRVGLGHRLRHLPTQLSGGEKQRVAIARSLVSNPTLLLADEPTGNLDSVTGGEIIALIRALHDDGRTILMITHDRHIAAEAPRRVRIHDGLLTDEVAA
jgi:putative ABC transport system ATP-binding protein